MDERTICAYELKPEVQDQLIHTEIPSVVAINWFRHPKSMLQKTYTALSQGMYRINEVSLPKLVTALRTATTDTTDNNGDYAKDKTSWSDVLDSFLQLSILLK